MLELLKKAQAGDKEATDKILEQCTHIIDRVLLTLRFVKIDSSTKRYGAILGLYLAIKNFKIKNGINFEKYAYQCAVRKAQSEMSEDWLIRLPRAKLNSFLKKKELPYELMSLGSSEKCDNALWYSETDKDGDEIVDRTMPELTVQPIFPDTEAKQKIKNIINRLNVVEKDAIYHKYGFINMTLKEVGEKHNLSHERIRQVHDIAFKKVKFRFFKQKIIKTKKV